MQKEPQNQEVNADLKDTREIVNRKLQKEGKNTFKKIQIVEEDEEEVRNEEQREIKRQKNEQQNETV
jgi:hypothetical protein